MERRCAADRERPRVPTTRGRLSCRGLVARALAAGGGLPLRRRALPRTFDAVGVRPGERVLELGPGPGVFTVEAARRVGSAGRVMAVDVPLAMAGKALARVR